MSRSNRSLWGQDGIVNLQVGSRCRRTCVDSASISISVSISITISISIQYESLLEIKHAFTLTRTVLVCTRRRMSIMLAIRTSNA